ncbi:hypothetical protein [Rhodococcus sp. YH3-3]|uniref:hypothetical protein n=1 Tax=Rhodococcus sp. YH3-3 TaxID=1803579 RepID=UPI000A3E80E8|nr:hypothetical protein [Rhodococcus sp. YH3-3]
MDEEQTSTGYVTYLIEDQCKILLNMSDQQIADALNVSRPTMSEWRKSPWMMPAGKVDKLVYYLESIKAMILTTESNGKDS